MLQFYGMSSQVPSTSIVYPGSQAVQAPVSSAERQFAERRTHIP